MKARDIMVLPRLKVNALRQTPSQQLGKTRNDYRCRTSFSRALAHAISEMRTLILLGTLTPPHQIKWWDYRQEKNLVCFPVFPLPGNVFICTLIAAVSRFLSWRHVMSTVVASETPVSTVQTPRLLNRVRQIATARFGRPEPAERYVLRSRRFTLFHGTRHPRELGRPEVGQFLEPSYLKGQRAVPESWRIRLRCGFSDLVLGNGRRVPLTPLREKSGTGLASETQGIAGSRVNVMDACATFFGDLAQRGLRLFQRIIWSTVGTKP
jgi:hypothetical protein